MYASILDSKEKMVSAPIVVAPDWDLPFELGRNKERIFQVIYYVSKTLNDAQLNYVTIEKELLKIVFAFDKF